MGLEGRSLLGLIQLQWPFRLLFNFVLANSFWANSPAPQINCDLHPTPAQKVTILPRGIINLQSAPYQLKLSFYHLSNFLNLLSIPDLKIRNSKNKIQNSILEK